MLNDLNGYHVTRDHALGALAAAKSGKVAEGNVGGGTGMICNGFKGGIGTSSRVIEAQGGRYTVGVLVQCNYGGDRAMRTVAGVDVRSMTEEARICRTDPSIDDGWLAEIPACAEGNEGGERSGDGSIIVVIATDAPLLPHQLNRIAKRPSLAIGRIGGIASDGSGDIFIAFSTANSGKMSENALGQGLTAWPNNNLSILFNATIEATEEAIINAMVAAEDMEGANGILVKALPEDQLRDVLAAAKDK